MCTTARLTMAVAAATALFVAGCSTENTTESSAEDRITPQSYGVLGVDVMEIETPKGVLVECVRVFDNSVDCDWEGADRTGTKDPIDAIDRPHINKEGN